MGSNNIVALNSNGKSNEALDVLKTSYKDHPYNPELLYALVTINRDSGNKNLALKYTNVLMKVMPDNPSVLQLKEQLEKSPN